MVYISVCGKRDFFCFPKGVPGGGGQRRLSDKIRKTSGDNSVVSDGFGFWRRRARNEMVTKTELDNAADGFSNFFSCIYFIERRTTYVRTG